MVNPAPSFTEQDAAHVLVAIKTWTTPPTFEDLRRHTNLPHYRLSIALSNLIYRTKQVEAIREYDYGWTWRYKAVTKPAFPPHIDIVINAIRASGGSADREAIWGRSPGLTWEQVDAALAAAKKSGKVKYWFGITSGKLWYELAGCDYACCAGQNTIAPSFNKPAVLLALLRGHGGGGVTNAHIEAAYTWAATAPKELLALVEQGDLSIQWQPTTGQMHYFGNREAAA